jgi:hypothetical protein
MCNHCRMTTHPRCAVPSRVWMMHRGRCQCTGGLLHWRTE